MKPVETPLQHAQKKEATFAKWEKRLGLIALGSLIFFELDADVHEIGFGIIEGILNWRRLHWKKQVEILSQGGSSTKANAWHLLGHAIEGREKHAKLRTQHRQRLGLDSK